MVAINAMVAITDYAALVEVAVKSKNRCNYFGCWITYELTKFVQRNKS